MALPLPRTFRDAYAEQRAARMRNRPRRTPITVRAARTLARVLPTWQGIRRFTLSVSGFAGLSYAAWLVSVPLGIAAAGVSLLILEALTGGDR